MHKVENLLSETLETYYWIGFLLADGCINKNKLIVHLSMLDQQHLKKLAIYLNAIEYVKKTKYNSCNIQLCSKQFIPEIMEKFDWKYQKTYNPPENMQAMTYNQFLAMFIGFIDGDGYINLRQNGNCVCRIAVHSSWINILSEWSFKLTEITKIECPDAILRLPRAVLTIGNSEIIKYLKQFVIHNKLPVLNRKWDKIDLEYESFYVQGQKNYKQISELYSKGIKPKVISETLNLPISTINYHTKKYRDYVTSARMVKAK